MILKQCSAAVLLLSFMAQVLSSPFIVFDYYYMNTAAYAKHCINKARIELHCNGKCQMAKELKQQEEREQQNPGGENSNKSPVSLFSKSWFTSAPDVMLSAIIKVFPVFQNTQTNDVSLPLFHPPTI